MKNEYVVLVKLKDGDYARDLACYRKYGWLFELYDDEEIEEVVAWHETLSVNPGWLT